MKNTPSVIYLKKFHWATPKTDILEFEAPKLAFWVPALKAYNLPEGLSGFGPSLTIYPQAIIEWSEAKVHDPGMKIETINDAKFEDIKINDFLIIDHTQEGVSYTRRGKVANIETYDKTLSKLKLALTKEGAVLLSSEITEYVNITITRQVFDSEGE